MIVIWNGQFPRKCHICKRYINPGDECIKNENNQLLKHVNCERLKKQILEKKNKKKILPATKGKRVIRNYLIE